MKNETGNYSEKLGEIFLNFADIQKEFVQNRSGIKAILNFIGEMSRKKPASFALDDPILVRGGKLMGDMIKKLENQHKILKNLTPPEDFVEFHNDLDKSLKLQIAGYKEMAKIFEDYKVTHALKGREKVEKALEMIEG